MIDYFHLDCAPGVTMFRCAKLSASLSVKSCASMWTAANVTQSERCTQACKACPVGAGHAGHGDPSYHRLRGSGACARCQRTDLRLICGYVCVACKNREYEWVKGKNAKGKPPIKHPVMARRSTIIMLNGEVKIVSQPLTVSMLEIIVQQLRDQSSRVIFGWGKGRILGCKEGL